MKARLSRIATILAGVACAGLASCMSAQPPIGMPDPSVIGFVPGDGGRATPPACAMLTQRSGMRDAGQARPGVAFGCATYSNLAAMLARPADLVAPVPYAGADAPLAASAVRRYEEDRTKPLNSDYSSTSSSSPSSSNSSNSSTGSR
ncbi:CpaD family pilus assembly protein [Paraburkholderia sp. RG36]|uniref:CpaD family pilus assembly protein n=2 Tax=Paraburkholderia tagetis TaxID=2913261 RepID=A0A9X1RUN0_9BURK|nr:CpaD family pilus assembly lipoprotein [Paraburkholderia tagetis]MCG5075274.1 CpaD family pilus assembly protein [Paraburkholderia tagetis]